MEMREEVVGDNGLCLQWIREGGRESYRIVCKNQDGSTGRGAPRFESMAELYKLLATANDAGWLGVVESKDSYLNWIKSKFKRRRK